MLNLPVHLELTNLIRVVDARDKSLFTVGLCDPPSPKQTGSPDYQERLRLAWDLVEAINCKRNRQLVGVAVVYYEGGILMLKSKKPGPNEGRWVLPGGKQEGEEKLIQTVYRELYEETGISAAGGFELGWIDEDPKWQLDLWCFKTRQTPKIMEPEKHSEWRWFDPFDETINPLSPNGKLALAMVRDSWGRIVEQFEGRMWA